MTLGLQRLFSVFPNGLPGAGLLLLRLVVGLLPVLCPIQTDPALTVSALLVLAGLLTPLSALAEAAALGVLQYQTAPQVLPPLSVVVLIGGCVALALLGPGAWSADARLFGRREIIIPRRRF